MKILYEDVEYDLGQLDLQELKELRINIESELDDIKEQLGRAKAIQKSTGEYSDVDWYWSAYRAKKHKQRQVQAIQMEQGKKRKIKPLPQYFVEVANEILSREVYGDIMAEAKLRKIEAETRREYVNDLDI